MSSVNEWMAREYLEALGFLVRQPRKYQVVARSKGLHEEVDLLAVNPAVSPGGSLPKARQWGAAELASQLVSSGHSSLHRMVDRATS